VPPPHCLPVAIGVMGDAVLPLNAAPYRVPVLIGARGTAIRPLEMTLPPLAPTPSAPSVVVGGARTGVDGALTGLGVRGGPVIADPRATVRGRPPAPRPVCDGVPLIQSSSSCFDSSFMPSYGSSSIAAGFDCSINVGRTGLYVRVGRNIGWVEETALEVSKAPSVGFFLAGRVEAVDGGERERGGRDAPAREGEVGGDIRTSSRSGRFAWRRSRVPKFFT